MGYPFPAGEDRTKKKKAVIKPAKKLGGKYNWPALKAEWIQENVKTGLTLNQFRLRYGVTQKTFYDTVEKNNWELDRDAIVRDIEKKISAEITEDAVDIWRSQEELWETVEKQALHILQQNLDPVDKKKLAAAMSPQDLASLTNAIERALKCRRLIKGKATEILQSENYHFALVRLTEALKKKNPHVIDSTHTIPELAGPST